MHRGYRILCLFPRYRRQAIAWLLHFNGVCLPLRRRANHHQKMETIRRLRVLRHRQSYTAQPLTAPAADDTPGLGAEDDLEQHPGRVSRRPVLVVAIRSKSR